MFWSHNGHMEGLSVVIPVYQHSGFLGQALRSVAQGSTEPVEVIVIDDGSHPPIEEALIRQAPLDVRLIHQVNSGAGAARNRGISEARFDLLMFLDADDLWAPHKVDRQLEGFRGYPGAIHFAWVQEFLDDNLALQTSRLPEVRRLTAPSSITLCCSRDLFDEHGGFDEGLRTGEFIEWFLRLQRAGVPARMFHEVLAYRRVHHGNRDRRLRKDNSDYAKILRSHLSLKANVGD